MVLVALNLLCNIDHGVLPAGSISIKQDLALNNMQYGMIGSAVFAGLTFGKFLISKFTFLGSVVATFAYENVNTKLILFFVLVLNALSLFMFT